MTHRVMRQNGGQSFWGARTFFTFLIPESAYPRPYPRLTAEQKALLGPNVGSKYRRTLDDGRTQDVLISELHTHGDPRLLPDQGRGPVMLAERDPYYAADRPDEDVGWTFWEAKAVVGTLGPNPWEDDPHPSDEDLRTIVKEGCSVHYSNSPGYEWLEGAVQVKRDQRRWREELVESGDWLPPTAAAAYWDCLNWSKTQYLRVRTHDVAVTFSIKTQYEYRMRAFERAAGRLHKAMRRMGHKVLFG